MGSVTDNDQNHLTAQVRTRAGLTGLSIPMQHSEYILDEVAKGTKLATIAQSIGLAGKGQAISNALASDPEYQAARESGLAERMDQREVELESSEPAYVPRARELLSHARWRAEREAPHRWGIKQDTHQSFGTAGITINIGTVQPPGITVEQEK